jgi:hypothetical protein
MVLSANARSTIEFDPRIFDLPDSLVPYTVRWYSVDAAFCHAQVLAHTDGRRRRVFKRAGIWRVDLARA